MESPAPVDLDALVATLKERVAARRAAGEYPERLEEDLAAHFERLRAHRAQEPPPELPYLEELVEQLDARSDFGLHQVSYESNLPGGDALHRAVGKVVSRQNASILQQLQHWANLVDELLKVLAHQAQHPPHHFHDDLWADVDRLLQRFADVERAEAGGPAAVAALEARVAALEASAGQASFDPWYSNDAFEAEFRGTRQELLDRYADLADRLVGCGPVLDVGCGRGELLELLAQRGVEAWGIEVDPALVELCVERGLDARHGDGLEVLRDAAPGALGGVTLIQVVEHLTSQQAVDLVALAASRVRPGGRVVVETVNPQSLYVYAHAFYLDPTHVRPVHPAWLTFLFREAGFAEVAVDWRSPPPGDDVLQPVGDADHDANVGRLNQLLFAPQDYAVVATRCEVAVHQVLVSASPADAITDSALRLRALLRRAGPSEVYALHVDPALAGDVRRLWHHPPLVERGGERDLLVFHASIGAPEVVAFLLGSGDRLAVLYHNITPASWYEEDEPVFAGMLAAGRAELRFLHDKVDLSMAVSAYNAAELTAMGHRDVRLSPLLVDVAGPGATPVDDGMTAELDRVLGTGPTLLFVGQLLPHKRVDLLLHAFHVLSTHLLPEARLIVAGIGRLAGHRRTLEATLHQLGLFKATLTGHLTPGQLAACWDAADVFVTASEHEGFCMPLAEAMAHEVPVIARRCAAIPETVLDAGLLLPAEAGPELLAEAMAELLTDADLRAELVRRGRERVLAFDPERAAATFLRHVASVA